MSGKIALLASCVLVWGLAGCDQSAQHTAEGLPMNEGTGQRMNQDVAQRDTQAPSDTQAPPGEVDTAPPPAPGEPSEPSEPASEPSP